MRWPKERREGEGDEDRDTEIPECRQMNVEAYYG